MKFISICSGIEAASVAWEPLGWTPLAFSEIEPFPCAVLKHHYPHVPNFGDMTKFDEWPEDVLAECDVLVGGCPCQAFSVAGLRQSLADARGNLTLVFVKLINHIDAIRSKHGRPPIIIVYENVPGIFSTGDNAFGNFLGALSGEDGPLEPPGGKWTNAGLVCGPTRDLAWRVLDAQYFGVAQRRRRVFLVGHSRAGALRPVKVLLVEQGVQRHSAPSREAGQRAAAAPVTGAQGGGGGLGAGLNGGRAVATQADVAGPLDSHYYKGPGSRQGGEREYVAHVVAPPLTASNDPSRSPQSSEVTAQVEAVLRAQYPEVAEVCGTISDGAHHGGGLNGQDAYTGRVLPVVPYDLFQITAPINRQNRDENSPCHTLARDNAAHAAVVSARPVAFAQNTRDEARLMNGDGSIVGALSAESGMHQTCYVAAPAMAVQHASGNHWDNDLAPHPTLCRGGNSHPGQSLQDVLRGAGLVPAEMAVRRLTPVECERLQGFPDDYTRIPWRGRPASECPDGPRYKALGNSMAVPCMYWIGWQIRKAMT